MDDPIPDMTKLFGQVIRDAMEMTFVAEMLLKGLDVTDDVLARETVVFIREQTVKSPTGTVMMDAVPPAQFVEWLGRLSGTTRKKAALLVAAALDEDYGISESLLAKIVLAGLYEIAFAKADPELMANLAFRLATQYASMCRRSGLAPEAWARAFHRSVDEGYWTFHRG